MTDDIIRKSCFDLATHLMWEKEALTIDKIEANMVELSQITDELHKIALEQFDLVEGLGGTQEMTVRAIDYINRVHAIPPLKGNLHWFNYTLRTILEIACPNSILDENSLNYQFLSDLERGINQSRQDVINE